MVISEIDLPAGENDGTKRELPQGRMGHSNRGWQLPRPQLADLK